MSTQPATTLYTETPTTPLRVIDPSPADELARQRQLANDLAAEILRRREKSLRDKSGNYPRLAPTASTIGPCAREMQIAIQHWDKRPQFEPYIQARMDRGRDIETLIVKPELARLGFEIVGGQNHSQLRSRDGRTVICSMRVDGFLETGVRPNVARFVFECKSMAPQLWARIDTAADMMTNRWTRKHVWQLLLYMYSHSLPAGLWLLDDCLGHWKILPLLLEEWLGLCEEVIVRCENVTEANEAGELLPFHSDPAVCRECWCLAAGVCLPPLDYSGQGVRIIYDTETAEALERVSEIEELGREYARLERKLKDAFKLRGVGRYLVGDHLVETETSTRKGYDVPEDVKRNYATTTEAFKTTWKRIGGEKAQVAT